MNKKTKISIIIATLILAVAIIVSGALLIVNNVGKTTLFIESETALAGDTVRLPISINKNHGLFVGQIVIKYNADALEFVSYSNGDVFLQCGANDDDGTVIIILNHNGIENTKSDGVVATLNFEIKETTLKGEYPISFYLPENVEDGTYFAKVQNLEDESWIIPNCENGKIIVK